MADLPPMGNPNLPPVGGVALGQSKPSSGGIGGMFGKKPVIAPIGPNVQEIADNVNDISRRMRVIEERYFNMRKKLQVIEHNMLHNNKKIFDEIKVTNSDFHEVKRDIDDVKTKFMLIVKEIKMLAKKEDVDVISKYVDMWQPVNFVTRKEVQKMIDERLKELLEENEGN